MLSALFASHGISAAICPLWRKGKGNRCVFLAAT
jgi:hypothetical protein